MDDKMSEKSNIAAWYAGKSIFITGSTGFMGKVLVEKLLRNCQDIKILYLLVRPKNGEDFIARKKKYFECRIFKKIIETNKAVTDKIQMVEGNLLEDHLGLSDDDQALLVSHVDIIFHCGANVRFDQPLKPMLRINLGGTLKVLELSKKMKQLNVLVYLSTSYCQCNEKILEERAYPVSEDPLSTLKRLEKLDDKTLKELTPSLLCGQPNTYAYSKALTEALLNTYGHILPIVVCRPSIVTASIKEPMPGWIEGVNGPTGLMIGAARGIIRSMHCNPEYPATVIPVDTAINAIIVTAWDRANQKSIETKFCNVCISSETLFSWGESIEAGKRIFYELPLSYALWYPDGSIKRNYYHHLFCVIFFHYLPAYMIDGLLLLIGRKPFLIRIQKKVSTGLKLLQYYTTKPWQFKNDYLQELNSKLSPVDKKLFDILVDQINWEDYIRNYISGMRTFMLNETDDTLPQAKRMLRWLYIIDVISKFVIYGFLFWFLWMYLDIFIEKGDTFISASFDSLFMSYNNETISN